jgi:hypothetical protein
MRLSDFITVGSFAAFLWWALAGGALPALPDWNLPNIVAPAPKAKYAVYVYEKDSNAIPSAVMAGMNALNRQGIIAPAMDDDVTDGEGQVPEQLKVPLEESRKHGLPLLVVMDESYGVLRVVKAPTTAEQVTEAIR